MADLTRRRRFAAIGADDMQPERWRPDVRRGVLDYREPVAERCPTCGSPVEVVEQRGMVGLDERDVAHHAQWGADGPGLYETVWLWWSCTQDDEHYHSPPLMAG